VEEDNAGEFAEVGFGGSFAEEFTKSNLECGVAWELLVMV
jgi:hypothetical protein